METLIKKWDNGDRLIVDFDVERGNVVISSDINDTNEDRVTKICINSDKETQVLNIRQYASKGTVGSYYKMFDFLVMEARLDRYGSPLTITVIKDGNED
ncbi:MAG: hypothetical protein IJE78_00465 [Bacteroidaceae bacterium]|nr:hypothetical protein [Bacteroidaceae bacterium]MBQ2855586.1 hypothetical protein [Bacteroidaceae bacterium]